MTGEPHPSMGFRVLAIIGVLTLLFCAGLLLHTLTHWYFWSGQ